MESLVDPSALTLRIPRWHVPDSAAATGCLCCGLAAGGAANSVGTRLLPRLGAHTWMRAPSRCQQQRPPHEVTPAWAINQQSFRKVTQRRPRALLSAQDAVTSFHVQSVGKPRCLTLRHQHDCHAKLGLPQAAHVGAVLGEGRDGGFAAPSQWRAGPRSYAPRVSASAARAAAIAALGCGCASEGGAHA